MLLRLANAFLAAVVLLMLDGGKSIAADRLPPVPAVIGLPPAPVVIGFPEPSRLRPGVIVRRPDGTLGFSPGTIRVEKLPQRGWVTVSGILSLVLAIYIGSQFPTSALWVIGMLFGIEMMFSGWAFVMIAMAARGGKKGEQSAGAGQAGQAAAG